MLLWLPVIVGMAAIFVASSMPEPPAPGVSDVSLHIAAYFGLTILLNRALARGTWRGVTLLTLVAAWAIAFTYGISIEWHQSFVPNRHAELRDIGANAIGAFGATVVGGAWAIIRRL